MRPEEVAAREEVRDTIARYAHGVERGPFAEAAACFTEDGVLEIKGMSRHDGRDAIAAMFAGTGERLASTATTSLVRHNVSSTRIEVDVIEGTATASSYFFVVTEIGPDHWGTYRDELRRDDATGRWLFSHRKVTVDGRADNSRMA